MIRNEYFMKPVDAVSSPRIVVRKAQRVLELYDGELLLARIRAATGRGAGTKRMEGDLRTPEGRYYICVKNDKSQFHLSIGISYPNIDDARLGLAAGLITQDEHDAIVSANRTRSRPPWGTGLGGEIMIHGGGSRRDWTAGCVALDDDAMDYVWKFTEIGMDVEIHA